MARFAGVPLAEVVDYLDHLVQVSKYDEGEASNGLMIDRACWRGLDYGSSRKRAIVSATS